MKTPRLVAITPSVDEHELFDLSRRVRTAVEAGLTGLLLRLPRVSDGAYLEFARAARGTLDGGWLALHDRPHLARELGANAVHLGGLSLTPLEARRVVGESVLLGYSSHSGEPVPPQTDYVTHSPVRPTRKDDRTIEGLGFEALARFCADASVPVLALGGLGPDDVAAALAAGAHGVAAIGSLLGSPDPAAAASEFERAFAAATR